MAKYLGLVSGIKKFIDFLVVSTGAPDAGKPVATNAQGKIDNSLLPSGVGVDLKNIISSESLSAGNAVNIWDDAGTLKVRRADNTARGKMAHGFVLQGVTAPDLAAVISEGVNDQLSGLVPGAVFLSSTAGVITQDPSTITASGSVLQCLGVVNSANEIFIEIDYNPEEIA